MDDSVSCSISSASAGEPLGGTAVSDTRWWLGIEVRAPWTSRAVEEAVFPERIRALVDAFADRDGARVQLLRRPGRTGRLRVVFADVTPGAHRRHAFEVDGHDDLARLDLDGLVAGTAHPEALEEGPEVWVCTHAKRDTCCGLHGGRLFATLRAEMGDAVWQTSHLGGHRFAPTLLWLPHGLSFGRVQADDAAAFAAATRRGLVHDVERLRGRCAWSAAVQAAEVAFRRATGWRSLDAPALLDVSSDDDHVRVTFAGHPQAFEVRRVALSEAVVPSCGKPPGPGKGWVVVTADAGNAP